MVVNARSTLIPQCWPLLTRIPSVRLQPAYKRSSRARYTADDTVDADPDYALGRPIFQENTPYPALRQAEQDIREYCQTIDDEQQYQKCVNTLRRLKDETRKAYQGISVLESAVDAQETLERLESMARELSSCKSSKLMVDALAHLQHMQDKYGPGGEEKGVVREALEAEERERKAEVRARLREVFDRVDTNGNGVVDIAEFRAAMDSLGKHLDGYMVAEICQALDIHAGLTFDQFCDIVDAEEVRSPEAARLRALIHNSPDDHYAEWIKSWC